MHLNNVTRRLNNCLKRVHSLVTQPKRVYSLYLQGAKEYAPVAPVFPGQPANENMDALLIGHMTVTQLIQHDA